MQCEAPYCEGAMLYFRLTLQSLLCSVVKVAALLWLPPRGGRHCKRCDSQRALHAANARCLLTAMPIDWRSQANTTRYTATIRYIVCVRTAHAVDMRCLEGIASDANGYDLVAYG